jgi:ketosteroid isomerase-like protein
MDPKFAQATALVMRFFRGLDTRDHAAVAALMAPDGVWVRQGKPLNGPAAVMAALKQRPVNRVTCHLITNVWAEHFDAQRARLNFYLTAYEGSVTDSVIAGVRMLGMRYCTDELVYLEDGWRIREKTSVAHMPAP